MPIRLHVHTIIFYYYTIAKYGIAQNSSWLFLFSRSFFSSLLYNSPWYNTIAISNGTFAKGNKNYSDSKSGRTMDEKSLTTSYIYIRSYDEFSRSACSFLIDFIPFCFLTFVIFFTDHQSVIENYRV